MTDRSWVSEDARYERILREQDEEITAERRKDWNDPDGRTLAEQREDAEADHNQAEERRDAREAAE